MSRRSHVPTKEQGNECDWNSYQDFLHSWNIGNLTEDNKIYQKVENLSLKICRSYGSAECAMHVSHTVLVALAKGKYKKGRNLDRYIGSVLRNEVIDIWNLDSGKEEFSPAGTGKCALSSRVVEEIFRRIASETNMGSMMAARPELKRNIIELIIACNDFGTAFQNKIIRTLEPELYRKPKSAGYIKSIRNALRAKDDSPVSRFVKFLTTAAASQ